MTLSKPYFMENENWYIYDIEQLKYVLTEEGLKHQKVVNSYNEFYKSLESAM